MSIALDQLPDDVDALKALVADQVARNQQLQADKQAAVEKSEYLNPSFDFDDNNSIKYR